MISFRSRLGGRVMAPGNRLVWIPGVLLALLLSAAPGASQETSAPKAGVLQQGLQYYQRGELDRALPLLLDVLATGKTDPAGEAEAALVLSRIYYQRNQYDQTLHYLQRIPASMHNSESRLLEGSSLVQLGRSAEGILLLLPLQEQQLTPVQQGWRLAALADGHLDRQNWLQALFFIHAYLSQSGDQSQAPRLQKLAGDVIAEQLSDTQLAEASFMFSGSAVGQAVGLQRALNSWRSGEEAMALQLVETILQQPNAFPGREQAVQLRDRLAGVRVQSRVLGVILPLSGRYAAFGRAVQRGMELALEQLGSVEFPVQLIYKDSGGDPETSARAVSELANTDQALAALGPLTGVAAEAAAARAQLERLPLLTLSQRDGLAETGPYVFRSSLTSTLQARTLARYAVEEKGLRSFAVLAPDNRLGQDMSRRFRAEIERLGGRIVASQSYVPEATDFRRQILQLKGENPNARQSAGSEERTPQQAKLPFEALFIPDYAEKVGLIAPQLAYYGVRGVDLLGINGWNDPQLVRLAGEYVEGAVFPDGFFRYSPYPFVQSFVNSYFERYGEEPTILEAQGYDAAAILLAQFSQGAELSRDGLRESLSRLWNYPGVAGSTSFDQQGDAQKVLFLLQVQNGNIVQIN